MTSWAGTMLLGVETGLAIAIGLALLIVIYESAFPHTALLGRVGNTTIYRNVKQFPNSQVKKYNLMFVLRHVPVTYVQSIQLTCCYTVPAATWAQCFGLQQMKWL
eukprot:GHUV01042404.1.p1 GENE.GHUV01042404.1~~GHUV01042404.1.p1  ORF type:complete len:105 (+),score=13.79 GHUV01042404.1:261-575(+)